MTRSWSHLLLVALLVCSCVRTSGRSRRLGPADAAADAARSDAIKGDSADARSDLATPTDGADESDGAVVPTAAILDIQHLAVTIPSGQASADVSITPVDPSFAAIVFTGFTYGSQGDATNDSVRIEQISPAMVRVRRHSARTNTATAYFSVVSLNPTAVMPVKTYTKSRLYDPLQPVSVETIDAVDATRALVVWNGVTSSKALSPPRDWTGAAASSFSFPKSGMNTQVNWHTGSFCCNDGAQLTTMFQVVEFQPGRVEIKPVSETIANQLTRVSATPVSDPAASFLVLGGPTQSRTNVLDDMQYYISALRIKGQTIEQRMGVADGGPVTQRGFLVRYLGQAIKQIVRGEVTIPGGQTTATASLPPFNRNKTLLFWNGDYGSAPFSICFGAITLALSKASVTGIKAMAAGSWCDGSEAHLAFELVEFN